VRIMNVLTRTVSDTPVVELAGELDISTSQEVEQELLRIDRERPPTVVVDLRALTFIDSTGLRTILAADTRCRQRGGRLLVVPGPPAVHRVFRISLLDQRLEFIDDPDAIPERAEA
jgi:anti-anti-sigma factor